jgi:phosphopantetheinyl transferase
MRRVLALYLDTEPTSLFFEQGPNGKPELILPALTGLSFNLSHSATDSVLAVARAPAIGIDLEQMTRADATWRISQHFFSHLEQRQLSDVGERYAKIRALMLWCLKESVTKANGDSIWNNLATVSLSLENGKINWTSPTCTDGYFWTLCCGVWRSDYVIALARKLPPERTNEYLDIFCYRLDQDPKVDELYDPMFRS